MRRLLVEKGLGSVFGISFPKGMKRLKFHKNEV